MPLLLALTAVMATIGLMGPISHISAVDSSVNEVILLIGLAVGVDYSMFYLRREREERESGRSESASLAAAAATSGRAVMISGLTVMVAMAGMYLAGASTFQSFATGTILVVAVAVVGSLTVLPATLAWLGDRIEKGGVPIIKDQPWNAGESALWSRILNPVLRHPVVSVVAAGGLLVVLSIPAFSLHTANPGVRTLPQDLSVIQTYNRIQEVFPGGPIPAIVAVSAEDVTSPEVKAAIADLRQPGRLERRLRAADHDRRQLRPHGRPGQHPAGRGRQRLAIDGGACRAAGQAHSGDGRQRCRASPPT